MSIKKTTLAKVIAAKFGYDDITAEAAAGDFIRSDFRLNGITTMGQAIAFLDYIQSLRRP